MKSKNKFLVGLTGGIGSGKSTVAELFRKHGIEVIDLDEVGREIYSLVPDLVEKLEKELKTPLKDKVGKFDKNALRKAIFSTPELKKKAENILHPLILKEFESRAEKAKSKIVICEAALLIETKSRVWEELIVVWAPEKERVKRSLERDGLSSEEIERVLKSQVGDEERKKHATHWIENHGSKTELDAQVAAIVSGWKAKGLL